MTRTELDALCGSPVFVGRKAFRLRGVETFAVERQPKGRAVGLLGEYVA